MERRASDAGEEEEEAKAKGSEEVELFLSRPPPRPPRRAAPADVQLAAIAVCLRVRPRAADMPLGMQERAFRCTRALVEASPNRRKPNLTLLALAIKKVLLCAFFLYCPRSFSTN